MTLHEFIVPYHKYMTNVATLVTFLIKKRKDKQIVRLVKFIDGIYDKIFRKWFRIGTISTIIYTIIDIAIEIGLILLLMKSNDRYLQILISILIFGWTVLNLKLFYMGDSFSNSVEPILRNPRNIYKTKQYHKSIESSKKINNEIHNKTDHLNKNIFDSFLYDFKYFKMNVCSLGTYAKIINNNFSGSGNILLLAYCYYNTCLLSRKTYLEMIVDIHSTISEKYKTSKEIFDDLNVDKLNEYIDKKFDSVFIESIFNNITPTDSKIINILFILLTIMDTYDFVLKFEDKESKKFTTTMFCYDKPVNYTIQMIELKIFQYGFEKLKDTIKCMDDEELINVINTFKAK